VCQQQPLRVKESKVFIVNTDKLCHPDDLKADDLGGWKNDGQHSRWIKVAKLQGQVSRVELCSGKPKHDPTSYCLHRSYFIHRTNSLFKRKFFYLSGMLTSMSV